MIVSLALSKIKRILIMLKKNMKKTFGALYETSSVPLWRSNFIYTTGDENDVVYAFITLYAQTIL